MNYPYVIVYINESDSNRTYKEVYFDSLYSIIISRSFFLKDVANGSYYSYINGEVFQEANFKNGIIDGKRTTYRNGRIHQVAYFISGIKSGTWLDYNNDGRLIKKIKYDKLGNPISVETF